MPRALVNQLQPGAVLAAPVDSPSGQRLLGEGTRLGASHIALLRQRGVELVDVQEAQTGASDSPGPSEASLKEIVLRERRRFGDTRSDPLMAEIFRCVVARAAQGRLG